MEELKEKWNQVARTASERFAPGEELDVDSLVFIVGLQEVNQPYRPLKKEEKLDVMHVGICALLTPLGYYERIGRDEDGWPHYRQTEDVPFLKPGQQTLLMKEALVTYFEDNGWI